MERAASDMQKENRGYLLTGDPAFIDGYEQAASDFYTFQGYLSVLVASEPDEVKRLNRIGERTRELGSRNAPCPPSRRSTTAAVFPIPSAPDGATLS